MKIISAEVRNGVARLLAEDEDGLRSFKMVGVNDTSWFFSSAGIEAWDVFEHVNDPILFITECHRILRPFKYLHLHTPHYMSPDAFTDPTHKRFPTEHTFDYWIPGRPLFERHNAAYGAVSFELVDMHMDQGSLDVTLRKMATGAHPGLDEPRADLASRVESNGQSTR